MPTLTTCEVSSHPVGTLTGDIVRTVTRPGLTTLYIERVCPTCHRVQGVARVRKTTTVTSS